MDWRLFMSEQVTMALSFQTEIGKFQQHSLSSTVIKAIIKDSLKITQNDMF